MIKACLLIVALSFADAAAAAAEDTIDFSALSAAWSPADLWTLAGHPGATEADRGALATRELLRRLSTTPPNVVHPAYLGTVGTTRLIERLQTTWNHASLDDADRLLTALGGALNDGVITGYDLRSRGVYDGFRSGHTLTYSHSSPQHLTELALLMSHKGLNARVYQTPKVSAFLYRDGWEGDPDQLASLPDGTKVINGRETATLFEFESKADRVRFHKLIMQYAKKDASEEAGLIANSWWQPFYYSDEPVSDFREIALTFVSDERFEATLTSTLARRESVSDAFADTGLEVRTDRVWVNPAFYRFLGGGHL